MSDSPGDKDNNTLPSQRKIDKNFPEDIIKIMLATDNHVGFLERDPIRGQDAINTFQEILQLAVKHDVDLILLGGDLFHENRPSRDCIYRVTALLREYTLGDKPISIELLSNPDEGKASGFSFPGINYEDENFNVAIPVFSIHGNHDDPQGTGPDGALSALDLLSVTGLINYMGKVELEPNENDPNAAGISVKPVLLRKGRTRLGLYGIGNIKDARMHYELRSNRVRMFMPKDKEDWFNILSIHQNRVKHGPQQFVPEGMFDDSINVVIWGHEHDCRLEPELVAGKEYVIIQPGSSVATSLADGESQQKHVALLEIQKQAFRHTPIPLRTVRPFVMDEITLMDLEVDGKLNITKPMEVNKYLKSLINSLIEKANAEWDERNAAAIAEGEKELPKMLPLVRLKVDTTDVPEMSNPVRFGQEFTGRVANPRDLLAFHRTKKTAARSKVHTDAPELSIDDPKLSVKERLERIRVETLVREYLAAQELQLLGEHGMSDAIQTFVDKDDIHSISRFVTKSLSNMQSSVATPELNEEELEERLNEAKKKADEEYVNKNPQKRTDRKKKNRGDTSEQESVDSMMLSADPDLSDFEEAKRKPTGKNTAATTKKGAAKGKGKQRATAVADSEEEDVISQEEEVQAKPKKSRTAVAPSIKSKKPPATKKDTLRQTTIPVRKATGRVAATKAKTKLSDVIVSDEDNE